ncbi:cupin domain-containing protein [Xylophilus sp. GOD-11R]|uniref:cupin domain-containing protein n=1 Tax=Xylophilus sp. GOD-11R TaxID=3089814 RepID=UPI00298C4817|nr:cupin domain-containing protein [Xylophilus sp. GOD-11R]WPB58302.1 cupin domain-containing protein [Xylophilus sp. GOD-11R]
MSEARILRPSALKAYERGGGARTVPLVSARLGAQSFINGITEFGPGAQIPWHFHNCEESVMLLEGRAVFDIGEEHHDLQPQDTTFIPCGVPHRFRNASDTEGMKILWIYGRVDATRTLLETGETRAVSAEHV